MQLKFTDEKVYRIVKQAPLSFQAGGACLCLQLAATLQIRIRVVQLCLKP